MSRKLPRKVIYLIIAIKVLLIAAGLTIWLLWQPDAADLQQLRETAERFLQEIPLPVYFTGFVILPIFGAPLSLFYLTALPVMGTENPLTGLLLAWIAITLNMTLTNLLTRGIFHPVIEKIIRNRSITIPKIRKENEWKIVLAVRVSPLPFCIQNYILSLGHSRWRYYLWFSLPIQAGLGTAVMLVGESILTGGISYVLLAIFLVLVINLALQGLRKKLMKEKIEPTG